MSKLGSQGFINYKINSDHGREWSFCTEIKTPVLPFKLTGQFWHTGWDIPTCYVIDANNECWMDNAHGPFLRKTTAEQLINNAEDIVDRSKIRKILSLPLMETKTMNLIEALKKYGMIRRPDWISGVYLAMYSPYLYTYHRDPNGIITYTRFEFFINDLLAEDWETFREKK